DLVLLTQSFTSPGTETSVVHTLSLHDALPILLNAQGGLGLMEEYFGLASEGTGQLNTFGGQYDLSIGNLLRYPQKFKGDAPDVRSEEHTSELQSRENLVCRLLLEKKQGKQMIS